MNNGMKTIVAIVMIQILSLSVYAEHTWSYYVRWNSDETFVQQFRKRQPHDYPAKGDPRPCIEITEEQYMTGFTNLSAAVQAQLLLDSKKKSGDFDLWFVRERGLFKFFLHHINLSRSGATNILTKSDVEDWMGVQ
jgi:hypothetical protein